MNKQFLFSLLWPITLLGGASYYNMKSNGTSIVPQSAVGVIDRISILPGTIVKPQAVGDDIGFKDGFEPTAETANFTIYAQKGQQSPAIIVDKDTGNVYMPKGVIAGGIYSSDGKLVIDETGKWVGLSTGLKGDSCSITTKDGAKFITCGADQVALESLRGDSCSVSPNGSVSCGSSAAGVDISCKMIQGTTKIKCGENGPEVDLKGQQGEPGAPCKFEAGTTRLKCGDSEAVDIKGPKGSFSECTTRSVAPINATNGQEVQNIISCLDGEVLTGGGCSIAPPLAETGSYPKDNTWVCSAYNTKPSPGGVPFNGAAICCKR